ncbi:MAG: hypothetical protein H6745_26755 [Deltaproteobacteria bacterium]|nr:hypothetical protein [Deltaproteobacteria bacterium]
MQDGMHYPDEVFQYLEPATSHRLGHAWLPWEFARGARNWLIPAHYGALMELGSALGLDGHGLVRFLWLHNAVLATLLVPLGFRVGAAAARGDLRVGLLAAAACAVFPLFAYFAPHTLAEWHGLLLVAWAYALWLEGVAWPDAPGRLRRAFVLGLLLGGVFITRFGLVVFLPLPLLDLNFRGRFKELLAAGAGLAAALAVLGLVDLATWGAPFHSVTEYVRANWVEGAAERYEVKDALWYWQTAVWARLGLAAWLVFLPMVAFFHRHWRLVLAWAVPLAALSAVGIKQERFILPVWPPLLAAAASGWIALGDLVARALGPRVARARPARLGWAVAALALATTAAATLLTMGDLTLRMRAGQYQAQDLAGDDPDTTGVLIEGFFHLNGGHTVLHKNVPELGFTPALANERVFSHVITETPELTARLLASGEMEELAALEGGVHLLRRRDRLVGADATSLPATITRVAGGYGGGDGPLGCRAELGATVGLELQLSADHVVAAVRPVCLPAGGAGPTTGGWRGRPDASEGATPLIRSECPAGDVVVGLTGRAGALVDALAVVCGRAGGASPGDGLTRGAMRGGTGGEPFTLACPAPYRLADLTARSGDLIDAVGLRCVRAEGPR